MNLKKFCLFLTSNKTSSKRKLKVLILFKKMKLIVLSYEVSVHRIFICLPRLLGDFDKSKVLQLEDFSSFFEVQRYVK